MRIVIVGAGVAGLAVALQLRRLLPDISDEHELRIYESHGGQSDTDKADRQQDLTDATAVVGNSIGLASQAVKLLKSIDSRVYDLLKSRGCTSKSYAFRTARGHNLGVISAADPGTPDEYAITCPRHVLRDCLYDVAGQANIIHQKVTEVDLTGTRPLVRLADGSSEEADIVLGTDGVRSVVKKAIFGPEDQTCYAPLFEGFCGVGAFETMPLPETITKESSMVFTFGPTGSFGYCSAAPLIEGKIGWWSNWGSSQIPTNNMRDSAQIRAELQQRHSKWHDPTIRHIVSTATTAVIYPIWTTPELPLWSRKGAIILGDAAHTLQATSGQGACQALEDSVAFCLFLCHYLRLAKLGHANLSDSDVVELTAKGLYDVRHERVATIRERSRNLYLTREPIKNIAFEYLYYMYIFFLTAFPFLGTPLLPSSRNSQGVLTTPKGS